MSQYDDFICIKQHLATFEARFMWNLSNIDAELKKSVPYKKAYILLEPLMISLYQSMWERI